MKELLVITPRVSGSIPSCKAAIDIGHNTLFQLPSHMKDKIGDAATFKYLHVLYAEFAEDPMIHYF